MSVGGASLVFLQSLGGSFINNLSWSGVFWSSIFVGAVLVLLWQILKLLYPARLATVDSNGVPYTPFLKGRFWGNLDLLLTYLYKTRIFQELEYVRWQHDTFGPTIRFGGFFNEHQLVMTTEPDCVGYILAKNFENYDKGDNFIEMFYEFLGEGIFNTNGEIWKAQREIARPHFNRMEFSEMSAVFNNHATTVLEILESYCDTDKYIDVQDVFPKYTIDSFGEHFFGHNIDSLKKPSQFAKDFKYVQSVCAWRFRLYPFWKIFPKTEFLKALERMDEFIYTIIDEGLQDKNLDQRQDLLAHFIRYGQENNLELSRGYLRDMLLNFLLAGRDTTAALLGWVFYCLSSHPEVERKLIDEVDSVLQGELPNESNVRNMKYLSQVLKETLRLYPSVPFDVRTAKKDDVLPNGYAVMAGTDVGYTAYIQHRRKDLFGEDAEQYDPDRWAPHRVNSIRPFYWVPFHAGPRICLGQHMALLEASVMVARILQKYTLSLKPNHPTLLDADIILTSAKGLPMKVTRRKIDSE